METIKGSLFLAEFGQPTLGSTYFNSTVIQPIFIVANDYGDASEKAERYLEEYDKNKNEAISLFDKDGSLAKPRSEEKQYVTSVKLLTDNIIR